MRSALPSLWVWGAREVLRHPGQALVTAAALAALVTTLGALLLLGQGLARAVDAVLDAGPSLVVRRVGPGGWEPMPADAVEAARGVRGVVRAEVRTWGVVQGPYGTLTLAASTAAPAPGLAPPAPGQAWVGPGVDAVPGEPLFLEGAASRTLRVAGRLPPGADLVAHDLVLAAPVDARALLGLAPDAASDLALWVHHPGEADAIQADLARALAFPVRFRTSREDRGAVHAWLARATGTRTLLLVPALLALLLLTAAGVRAQVGGRAEIGLLKALGWTQREILALHLARALVVALPALAAGAALAWGLVFVQGASWAGPLLLGWQGPAPALALDHGGAAWVLLEVGGLVLAPWMAATLLPVLAAVTADPEPWLRGEEVG